MEDPISLSDEEEYTIPNASPILVSSGKQSADQELLVMTVEIGDGRQDVISVYANDDPAVLAEEFAKKHSLTRNVQDSLTKLIRQNKELVEKRAGSITPDLAKWADLIGSNPDSNVNHDFYFDETQKYPKKYTPKINRHSKELASKRTSMGNVHERLYNQSKKPSKEKDSNSSTVKKSPSEINYGEWLYIRGLKMKENIQKKGQEFKEKKEREEQNHYNFKPQINKLSSTLSERYFEKTEDMLLRKHQDYKDQLDQRRKQALEDELKECSFVPKLSIKGNLSKEDSRKSVHQELFLDAEKRKERLMNLSEENFKNYSFKPKVQSAKKRNSETEEEFLSRLTNFKKEKEKELEKIRKEKEELEKKSVNIFHPEICREPKTKREEKVWNYLHKLSQAKTKKVEEQSNKMNKYWETASVSQKASETSNKIYENFRERQFRRLFSLLDSDKDGKVSHTSISIDGLENRALEVMTPFFEYLEESKGEVNFQQFSELMEQLRKKLSVEERAILLKREPKEEETRQNTSVISDLSAKLAQRKRAGQPQDIYERMQEEKKMTQIKLEHYRKEKEVSEIADCTFKPSINSSKNLI